MKEPPEEPQGSLIAAQQAAEAAQPFLFPKEDIDEQEAYEVNERFGHYTAERLIAQRPRTYELIVRMIAEGLSTRSIARACGVSPNTIQVVRRREGPSIDAQKQELLELVRTGVRLCAERVVELAPEMDARDASVAFGIFSEKLQLLTGEATSIVAHKDVLAHEDFNRLLELLPADAHEVSPEMGLGAQAGGQKAPPALPPPTQPPPAAPISQPGEAKAPGFLQAEPSGTHFGSRLEPAAEDSQRGEGGVARDRAGGGHP